MNAKKILQIMPAPTGLVATSKNPDGSTAIEPCICLALVEGDDGQHVEAMRLVAGEIEPVRGSDTAIQWTEFAAMAARARIGK